MRKLSTLTEIAAAAFKGTHTMTEAEIVREADEPLASAIADIRGLLARLEAHAREPQPAQLSEAERVWADALAVYRAIPDFSQGDRELATKDATAVIEAALKRERERAARLVETRAADTIVSDIAAAIRNGEHHDR